MKKTDLLTQERLKEVLEYSPETGVFTWRKLPVYINKMRIGDIAGNRSKGRYLRIRVDNFLYYGHRLAWLYVHGRWPEKEIDHIDGDPSNNCLCNLRQAIHLQNGKNTKISVKNKTGSRGVSWLNARGKYRAVIGFNGKQISLGCFTNIADAAAAYDAAATRLFGAFKRAPEFLHV